MTEVRAQRMRAQGTALPLAGVGLRESTGGLPGGGGTGT